MSRSRRRAGARSTDIPTAAELQIVIEAQDRASGQLRAIGQDVARLSQAVAGVGGGFGRGLAVGISATADALRILGGVAQVAGQAVGAVADQVREGFASNVELERATIAFQRYTGSAEAAAGIIADLRREAAVSPFNDQEIISAGRALVAAAGGSRDALLQLVRVSEQLAVLDPLQGLTGGVIALQEALSGDFTSFVRRFEIPRTLIQQLKDQGVPNLEIVKRALEFRGVDTGSIEAFGRSFEGLQSTIQSFGQELRQLATAGAFQAIGEAFAHLVNLINRYGDQLRVAAQAIGQVMAEFGRRVIQGLAPLLGVIDRIFPGLGDAIRAEFVTPIQQAGDAAQRAAPQLQQLQEVTDLQRVTRQLADVGVAAAQLQIDAERLRRGYDDQLRPLERQRELLQNNAELQRVQNALATNRATTERLRTEREITALQRAARGVEDPNAPGLTDRQRAIALALQERRLRLEELGLTEQQRPALQTVEGRIAAIRREQADALAPLERQLALRREEADLLQITRTQLQQVADDAAKAADALGGVTTAAVGDDASQEANKNTIGQRADDLAKEWLDRFQKWVNENGGNAWTAIARSLTQWTLETGIPLAVRIGAQIGAGIFAGIAASWERLLAQNPLLRALLGGVPGGRALLPETYATIAGAPTVEEAAGRIVRSINVNVGGVQVEGADDPAFQERLKQALVDFLRQFMLTQATTDPGAAPGLQGAAR
jgi:hypothetical protein